MTSLNFITCKKCKETYFVGIDGRDTRKAPKSSGSVGKVPYIALGNDEIERCEELSASAECPSCRTLCKVETSTPVKTRS